MKTINSNPHATGPQPLIKHFLEAPYASVPLIKMVPRQRDVGHQLADHYLNKPRPRDQSDKKKK